MDLVSLNPSIDLTNCDAEKIHYISYVQGHGVFIAVSMRDLKIQNVSQNIAEYFPKFEKFGDYLGLKLGDLFSYDILGPVTDIIKDTPSAKHIKHHFETDGEGKYDVFVYFMDENILGIEIEKIQDSSPRKQRLQKDLVRESMIRMKTFTTPEDLGWNACHYVRLLTGFERVMLYRFFPPTMYGEVIAEDKVADAKTFNHHRFPATDIPRPARDLYLKNQIRYIHDSAAEVAEVHPKINHDTGKPLDFSDSRLRGVSRIHLEYLKNMNVRGSFSLAVVVDQKLWGLIACHHSKPHYIPHEVRQNAELLAQILALTVPTLETKLLAQKALGFNEKLKALFEVLKLSPNPGQEIFRHDEKIMEIFSATGLALIGQSRLEYGGITPMREDLKAIWTFIRNWMDENKTNFFVTESLSQFDQKFESFRGMASGVMAFSLSEIEDTVFILLRPEFLQTILWGGDPRKNFEERNYKGVINPRASFETWSEVIKSSAVPWEKFEVDGLKYFKSLIFDSLVRKEDLVRELHQQIQTLKK